MLKSGNRQIRLQIIRGLETEVLFDVTVVELVKRRLFIVLEAIFMPRVRMAVEGKE